MVDEWCSQEVLECYYQKKEQWKLKRPKQQMSVATGVRADQRVSGLVSPLIEQMGPERFRDLPVITEQSIITQTIWGQIGG